MLSQFVKHGRAGQRGLRHFHASTTLFTPPTTSSVSPTKPTSSTTSSTIEPNSERAYKVYKANEVFPVQPNHVTVEINNRDDKQSNVGSAVAHQHTLELLARTNTVCTPTAPRQPYEHAFPGCVQSWGGTFPMFAIWKRGLLPFAELVDMFTVTKGVPTMWLDRNVCLNGMSPYDVPMMKAFFEEIKHAKLAAGNHQPFVMQIFDAVNDPKQLAPVISAYKELGPEFPVMLYYSTSRTLYDPAIMNPRRAMEFFKVMDRHAPTEYNGLKQPEGCLSALQMRVLCDTIRTAQPDKPLHVHTQGIHGFAELQAVAAALGGATSIDAAVPFHSLAGQPFAPAIRGELIRNGFKVNAWNMNALNDLIDASKQVEGYYSAVSQPDRRFPSVAYGANIAGGQSSILKDELKALGIPHYYPQVEECNPITRRGSGSGVAVTPLADTFVRQTMALVREGVSGKFSKEDKQNLLRKPLLDPSLTPLFEQFVMTEAYALMILGDNGLLPSYPHPTLLHKSALLIAAKKVTVEETAGRLTKEQALTLKKPSALAALSEAVVTLSEPVRVAQYQKQIDERIKELKEVDPSQARQLEVDISLSEQLDFKGQPVKTIGDRIALFQAEKGMFPVTHAIKITETEYGNFLKTGKISPAHISQLNHAVPSLKSLGLTDDTLGRLLKEIAPLTIAAYLLKPDRLGPASKEIAAWEAAYGLKLPSEFRVCHALFKGHPLSLTEDMVLHRYLGSGSRWKRLSNFSGEHVLPSIDLTNKTSSMTVMGTINLHTQLMNAHSSSIKKLIQSMTEKHYWSGRHNFRKKILALPDPGNFALRQLHAAAGGDELAIQFKLDAATAAVESDSAVVKTFVRKLIEQAPTGQYDLGIQRIDGGMQFVRTINVQLEPVMKMYSDYLTTLINDKWRPTVV